MGSKTNFSTITVFGIGHVGMVMAACAAELGHRVYCIEKNEEKRALISDGITTVMDTGLDELVQRNHSNRRIIVTERIAEAVEDSEILFICVGTPLLPTGQLDISAVKSVAREIGSALAEIEERKTIVLRSTVMPGTTGMSLSRNSKNLPAKNPGPILMFVFILNFSAKAMRYQISLHRHITSLAQTILKSVK